MTKQTIEPAITAISSSMAINSVRRNLRVGQPPNGSSDRIVPLGYRERFDHREAARSEPIG